MKKIKWLAGIILLVLLMGNISVQIGETKSVAKVTEKEEGIMPNGSIPAKTKVYNKKDLVESKGKYSTASTIPKAYDAREEGIVTEVKKPVRV